MWLPGATLSLSRLCVDVRSLAKSYRSYCREQSQEICSQILLVSSAVFPSTSPHLFASRLSAASPTPRFGLFDLPPDHLLESPVVPGNSVRSAWRPALCISERRISAYTTCKVMTNSNKHFTRIKNAQEKAL